VPQQLSMESTTRFTAPWSASLKRTTQGLCLLSGLIALAALAAWWAANEAAAIGVVIVLMLVVALAALFSVRGYTLDGDSLTVRRLGWSTRLPLGELRKVSGDSEAFQRSLRLFGVPGVFSWSGVFWSRQLGRFRAYATDPARAVVLEFAKGKVVITPDDPQLLLCGHERS
jgi:hypothetical protein